MAKLIDITNKKFGRWVILKDPGDGKVLALCECSTKKWVNKYNVIRGTSKGCGCVKSKPGNVGFYLLYQSYKIRSRQREIDFLLTKIKSRRKAASDNTKYIYNGVDRVDNEKGYTVENSVPCCLHCNFAKAQMTQDQFRDLIINIYYNWANRR